MNDMPSRDWTAPAPSRPAPSRREVLERRFQRRLIAAEKARRRAACRAAGQRIPSGLRFCPEDRCALSVEGMSRMFDETIELARLLAAADICFAEYAAVLERETDAYVDGLIWPRNLERIP